MARKKKLNMRLNIQTIKFGELKKYANNPRINTDAIPMVAQSIDEFDYQEPIVVTADNTIICGHTRLEAFKQLGAKDDDLIDVQVFKGTLDKSKAYRLIDNRCNEGSGWDFELLELEQEDIDLNLDPWFPPLEEADYEVAEDGTDDALPTSGVEDTEYEEKKRTIVCPHCGQVIEL